MISVCMATHNGEHYVGKQIDSILKQLHSEDELIISDDGSTDNTISIIESYSDVRIRFLRFSQPKKSRHYHLYVSKNFENAIKEARGDYIFLSDQDDIWLENKITKCITYLEKNLLIVHDMQCINDEMNFMDGGYKGSFRFHNWRQISPTYFGCVMAFKKELKNTILPFPSRLMVHDYWIGMLAELLGKVSFVNEKLILYRVHQSNTSLYVRNPLSFKLYYRIYTLYHLFIRYIKMKIFHHKL